jgi:hypothetical protein
MWGAIAFSPTTESRQTAPLLIKHDNATSKEKKPTRLVARHSETVTRLYIFIGHADPR